MAEIIIESKGRCWSCKEDDKVLETYQNMFGSVTECTDCRKWREGLSQILKGQ